MGEMKGGLLKMDDIQQTLEERGNRYGDWKNHAQISQDIQNAMIKGWMMRGDGQDFGDIPAYMTEALTMISNKIGRILNGDPYYDDSWKDIVGYAQLVVNELVKLNDSQSDIENELEKENATKEL